MVRSDPRSRGLALGVAAVLLLAACGGPATTGSPSAGASAPGGSAAPSAAPGTGGTLYLLSAALEWNRVDPQRAYTGEDLAFFSGTIYRSLEAFKFSADFNEAGQLTPDLATDLGTPSDGAKTWTFTLRDGVSFQDGTPITCADMKYSVSRTFATSVIAEGPTYVLQYLNIPSVDGFKKDKTDPTKAVATSASAYNGPYSKDLLIYADTTLTKFVPNDPAAFDKAVECSADGKTITFHLALPVADFNYATTLGMSPVPAPPSKADTGETYATTAHLPVSSGPYQVESYTTGNGGKMVLVRNPNWSQASDPYRHPKVDKWVVVFGVEPHIMDQRSIQSSGNDQYSMEYGNLLPENFATVFKDPHTPLDAFKDRAVSNLDVYARYIWINVNKVTNLKIRQAMAVALDRAALRKNYGGDFYGDYADGVIKPTVGLDYAPSGLWETLFGKKIPDAGDSDLAKKLIADSGVKAPALTYDYADTPVGAKAAAIIKDSLEKAGFKITLNPIERGKYYSVVFDPKKGHEFGISGWGADWPNASTVIPPLFTQNGGFDLTQLDDQAFNDKVAAAQSETDRTKQNGLWQALNKEVVQNVYVIPTFFGLAQRIAGTKVGNVYMWGPYSSFPYGDMFVKP